jgi:hypothetical protein
VFDTNRFSIWYTLSYIGTRLRALVLGSVSLSWVQRTARAALVISAAPYVPQRILLLVWSVKALSAFDTRHMFSFACTALANLDELSAVPRLRSVRSVEGRGERLDTLDPKA